MKKQSILSFMLIIVAIALSGCLYPAERRMENQVPHPVYVENTQKAIDQYREKTGILPIVTKSADTPFFEKYEIDFTKLVPLYLPDAPANAFEKGGIYKYVLIDVETKPTVRLIDLSIVSKVQDVQQSLARYVQGGEPLPVAAEIGNGYYRIDYTKLFTKEPAIQSFYTNQTLPLIMNARGEVGIDYTADIAMMIRNSNLNIPKDTDPRYVVARESFFVPIKSFPYKMENGEPRLLKL